MPHQQKDSRHDFSTDRTEAEKYLAGQVVRNSLPAEEQPGGKAACMGAAGLEQKRRVHRSRAAWLRAEAGRPWGWLGWVAQAVRARGQRRDMPDIAGGIGPDKGCDSRIRKAALGPCTRMKSIEFFESSQSQPHRVHSLNLGVVTDGIVADFPS